MKKFLLSRNIKSSRLIEAIDWSTASNRLIAFQQEPVVEPDAVIEGTIEYIGECDADDEGVLTQAVIDAANAALRKELMQLGQKVTFTRQYKRIYVYNNGREWKAFDREGAGVYLGTRTLQNGRVDRDEDGSYFIRESCFEAALICPGTRINPIYVPLDAFTLHPECWSLAY